MRCTTILLVAFFLLASRTLTAQEHHHELSTEEVGSVHFVTSIRAMQPGDSHQRADRKTPRILALLFNESDNLAPWNHR